MQPYIIQQGDSLTRLAHERGFVAADVWQDSSNQDLRALRDDMDVLAPGDIVHLPPAARALVTLSPGQANRFSARIATVPIVLTLEQPAGTALANKAFHVYGAGAPIVGTTDGDGKTTLLLPIGAGAVRLVLDDSGRVLLLHVGHLDPIDTDSGVSARLAHLGYLASAGASGVQLRDALERFQADQQLTVSGEANDETRQKLVERHGC